jgi:hypothetical protein
MDTLLRETESAYSNNSILGRLVHTNSKSGAISRATVDSPKVGSLEAAWTAGVLMAHLHQVAILTDVLNILRE